MKLQPTEIVGGAREKWLVYAVSVRSEFYKFANRRFISEQDIEDVFQDVISHFVTNVDIDGGYSPPTVKVYLLKRLKGALLDFCRSKDSLARRSRNLINYIESKIKKGKTLEEVLAEESMTMADWNKLNEGRAVDFELGKSADILFERAADENGPKRSIAES